MNRLIRKIIIRKIEVSVYINSLYQNYELLLLDLSYISSPKYDFDIIKIIYFGLGDIAKDQELVKVHVLVKASLY